MGEFRKFRNFDCFTQAATQTFSSSVPTSSRPTNTGGTRQSLYKDYSGISPLGIGNMSLGTAYSYQDLASYGLTIGAVAQQDLPSNFVYDTYSNPPTNIGTSTTAWTVSGGVLTATVNFTASTDTTIGAFYFTKVAYTNTNKAFLVGAYYLDTPISVTNGQTITIAFSLGFFE